MEATTMRSSFFMFLAACAAQPVVHHGTGSGSSTESFTLDPTGFIVQGDRWWTTSSGPKLTGTIEGGGTLQAYVGMTAVGGSATVSGTTWTLDLPPNTIAASGTTIALRLGSEERDQLIALDAGKPVITSDSPMRDERGDTISFASGEPVHTHAGAVIDLGTGCPDVYKYAYLTDARPAYATETAPNPIAWHLSAASPVGIDPNTSQYRVRTEAMSVMDWMPLAADANDVYQIELHRDQIADLGTRDGIMYVDAEVHDTLGNAATTTYCFHYHPLAAPLEIQPIAAETQIANLWALSLPTDSPISHLLNVEPVPMARVVGQRIIQHASDPVSVEIALGSPQGTWGKTSANRYLAVATGSTGCGNSLTGRDTTVRCSTLTTVTNKDTTTSGTLASGDWFVQVVDEATGQPTNACSIVGLTATCTLPARAAGAPPQAYRFVSFVNGVTDLWPGAGAVDEYTLAGRVYTGYAATTVSHCNTLTTSLVNGVAYYYCGYTDYDHYIALYNADLAFAPFQLSYAASVGATVPVQPVSYALPASPQLTWNSGTDILPGQ
jgi:hypothetical protein